MGGNHTSGQGEEPAGPALPGHGAPRGMDSSLWALEFERRLGAGYRPHMGGGDGLAVARESGTGRREYGMLGARRGQCVSRVEGPLGPEPPRS